MDVKQAIEQRRSIRKYQDKKVPDALLLELIEAARLAPSGNNAQPWRFFIVKDKEVKDWLLENEIFSQKFVYTAPIIIICCTDPRAFRKRDDELDDTNRIRAVRDLSIASSFMVLRAQELGLGTCYVGWMKKEEVKKLLSIPEECIALYAITVGYPAEQPSSRPRKNSGEIVLNPKL